MNRSLEERRLVGKALTIADLAVGGVIPSATRAGLPNADFPQVQRWYDGLAELPAWQEALADQGGAANALAASQAR